MTLYLSRESRGFLTGARFYKTSEEFVPWGKNSVPRPLPQTNSIQGNIPPHHQGRALQNFCLVGVLPKISQTGGQVQPQGEKHLIGKRDPVRRGLIEEPSRSLDKWTQSEVEDKRHGAEERPREAEA